MLTYLLPYDPYRIVPDFCIRYFTDYKTLFLTNGTYCRFGEAHQQTITAQVNDCFCWDYSTDSSCRFFFFLAPYCDLGGRIAIFKEVHNCTVQNNKNNTVFSFSSGLQHTHLWYIKEGYLISAGFYNFHSKCSGLLLLCIVMLRKRYTWDLIALYPKLTFTSINGIFRKFIAFFAYVSNSISPWPYLKHFSRVAVHLSQQFQDRE